MIKLAIFDFDGTFTNGKVEFDNNGGIIKHYNVKDGKGIMLLQKKNINPPEKLSYSEFIKNTSIATSTMIVNSKIIKGVKFTNTKICEDYFFKCQILKKINKANCLNKYLTYYRVRQGSLQSNKLRNLFWIWKINYRYNKLSFFENLNSLFLISFNSIKKYGLK